MHYNKYLLWSNLFYDSHDFHKTCRSTSTGQYQQHVSRHLSDLGVMVSLNMAQVGQHNSIDQHILQKEKRD